MGLALKFGDFTGNAAAPLLLHRLTSEGIYRVLGIKVRSGKRDPDEGIALLPPFRVFYDVNGRLCESRSYLGGSINLTLEPGRGPGVTFRTQVRPGSRGKLPLGGSSTLC